MGEGAAGLLPATGAVLAALTPLLVGIGIGLLVHLVAFAALRVLVRRTATPIDDLVLRHGNGPLALLLPLLGAQAALPLARARLSAEAGLLLRQTLTVLFVLALGWAAAAAVRVVVAALRSRFEMGQADNLRARKVVTQLQILQQIALYLVALLTLAALLMTFEPVRRLGAGILASAGIAGVVLGFAAQKSLGNLLAGLQIAFTQPIRLDDVVIVEGEWGRIEEITLTYVVVRIWDLRRLVVPIGWFVEHPFQNWTRTSAELLGTVFLTVDHTVPVAAVREELQRILAASGSWDGRVWNLQVVDTDARGVQLRALMSAPDSGTAWDLRCEVRERLLDWLQREHPAALPRLRAEVAAATGGDGDTAQTAPLEPSSP